MLFAAGHPLAGREALENFPCGDLELAVATGEVVLGTILHEDVGLDAVVKTTVFLADLNDFAAMNAVYATYFANDPPPACTTIQAGRLPAGARIEIEVVALA